MPDMPCPAVMIVVQCRPLEWLRTSVEAKDANGYRHNQRPPSPLLPHPTFLGAAANYSTGAFNLIIYRTAGNPTSA